jgi:CHAT domain-containing protein
VDIKEAVKFYRLLLNSSHPNSLFAYLARISIGFLLLRTFLCTDKIEYLDEAISILWDVVNNPGLQLVHFALIHMLILLRSLRFKRLSDREDINAIMELLPVAVNDRRGRTPERFQLSCSWAWLARFLGHPCVSTAYDCAISLMQDTLTFAPTLDVQHSRLVAMRGNFETMPLGYASYLVHTGRLEQAVEILEQGRALIWSEMRGLRTSIDRLRATDSVLADNFTAVNRELERLTLTVFPTTNEGGGDYDLAGMDPFGNLVVQQRKLLNERDKLISRVQALPGFETFLKALPFNALQSAAADGPIIIINHCRWRSDILILLHNSPPSLIPTTHSFFGHASKLRDRLLSAQKDLDSAEYDDALRDVLKELYEIVGRPVIQRLDELGVAKQSRVWWCPTSVFCTLPLHAMGPIPSHDDTDPKKYFLDLYIPSYTTSLSALIESRKLGSQTLDKPSILLVAQPDANSMPEALKEMQVVQDVSTEVTTLLGAMATPTAVLERLRDHRFVHVVSHGTLVTGKPFEAWFKLYDGKRLSLFDIVRSRLPDAEFAFLSACSTAQLTDESLADEGLHLAAAMQYCGFRSVVGTMWKVLDEDGKVLAGNFYRSVFSEKGQGGCYYERTAKALRGAVRKLRGRRGTTLERWVRALWRMIDWACQW